MSGSQVTVSNLGLSNASLPAFSLQASNASVFQAAQNPTGAVLGSGFKSEASQIFKEAESSSDKPKKTKKPKRSKIQDMLCNPQRRGLSGYTQEQLICAERLGVDPEECNSAGTSKWDYLPGTDTTSTDAIIGATLLSVVVAAGLVVCLNEGAKK